MNIAAILLIASLSTLPPCPTEPVWDTANPCYAPGFCAVIPGQVLSWEHNPVDTTHFRACNEWDICYDLFPLVVEGPACARIIWPGINVPIPFHRYWEADGATAITVQACNDQGCSEKRMMVCDPWYQPQVLR